MPYFNHSTINKDNTEREWKKFFFVRQSEMQVLRGGNGSGDGIGDGRVGGLGEESSYSNDIIMLIKQISSHTYMAWRQLICKHKWSKDDDDSIKHFSPTLWWWASIGESKSDPSFKTRHIRGQRWFPGISQHSLKHLHFWGGKDPQKTFAENLSTPSIDTTWGIFRRHRHYIQGGSAIVVKADGKITEVQTLTSTISKLPLLFLPFRLRWVEIEFIPLS